MEGVTTEPIGRAVRAGEGNVGKQRLTYTPGVSAETANRCLRNLVRSARPFAGMSRMDATRLRATGGNAGVLTIHATDQCKR